MSNLSSIPQGLVHTQVLLRDDHTTRELGRVLAEHVQRERFLGLIGPLGAGKTTLMKGVAQALDIDPDDVTSPTYTLINEYEASGDLTLAHMDLYRLEHVDDLESIGYWDVLDDPWSIVCVEWLNTIWAAWPERGIIVELEPVDGQRMAHVYASEHCAAAVSASLDHFFNLCEVP